MCVALYNTTKPAFRKLEQDKRNQCFVERNETSEGFTACSKPGDGNTNLV